MTEIELSLPEPDFRAFIGRMLDCAIPDQQTYNLAPAFEMALQRTAECFSRVLLPGYSRNGSPCLNHLHGDQSAVFLYYLANSSFRLGERNLAEKCMLLNKARNGIVITYDTELPAHMLLVHTVGTMLGKATYGDYFVATQNVTVGRHQGHAPIFDRGIILHPHSLTAGSTRIGEFSRVAAGAIVLNGEYPARSIVAGAYPNTSVRPTQRETINEYFALKNTT